MGCEFLVWEILGCEIFVRQILGRDQIQEPVGKLSQIFLPAKVVNDLHPRGVAVPIQPTHRKAIFLAHQFMEEEDPTDKTPQLSRRIEEPRSPGYDEFGDSGKRRRKHNSAPRHRFHEYQRNAFTTAGKHNYIGATIE